MAIKYFDCKGYGQLEPSQVWFTRAGMSESQCELDPDLFASSFPVLPAEAAEGKIVAEVGQFLMIDKERKIATVPSKFLGDRGFKMGINYSTEKILNQFTPGRRNFCMIAGEYNPRIGFIEPGMRICTNTVAWDTDDYNLETSLSGSATPTTSKGLYNAVKASIATMNAAEAGRRAKWKNPGTDGELSYENDKNKIVQPIYCGVTDKSMGKLVIGIKPENAIGGVLGIVTEAYYNADGTDSFKILFIDPAQATKSAVKPADGEN